MRASTERSGLQRGPGQDRPARQENGRGLSSLGHEGRIKILAHFYFIVFCIRVQLGGFFTVFEENDFLCACLEFSKFIECHCSLLCAEYYT